MTPTAEQPVIRAIADAMLALPSDRPQRIAVAGITAAGKSTFADQLAAACRPHRPVLRASIDDFHNPLAERLAPGLNLADSYYERAHNLEALITRLFEPIAKPPPWSVVTASLDLATDRPVAPPPVDLQADTLLIIDGTFLFKPILAPHLDCRIWLHADFDIAEARGAQRDAGNLGGEAAARIRYQQRYHAACRRYIEDCQPATNADWQVDNNDPAHPVLLVRPPNQPMRM